MPQDPVTVYESLTGAPAVMHGVDAAEAVRSGAYRTTPLEGVTPTAEQLAAALAVMRAVGPPVQSSADWRTNTTPQTMGAAEMHYGDLVASRDVAVAVALDMQSFEPAHALPLDTPVNAVASTLTTALSGTNDDLTLTAKTKGLAGDSITLAYVDPAAASQALAVMVTVTETGLATLHAIEVALATNGASAITSTAAHVAAALAAHEAANALVAVTNAAANDGTGVVTALAETPLAGGVDGTIGYAGQERLDATYRYSCVADNDATGTNWRRVAWPVVY